MLPAEIVFLAECDGVDLLPASSHGLILVARMRPCMQWRLAIGNMAGEVSDYLMRTQTESVSEKLQRMRIAEMEAELLIRRHREMAGRP